MKYTILLYISLICTGNLLMAQKKQNRNFNYHTFLGVDVDNTNIKTNGLFVNGVYKGYGAEKAGLQRGDLLMTIDNTAVRNFNELVKTLDEYNGGDDVEVAFMRNNILQKTTARLSDYPEFLKYNSMQWLKKMEADGFTGEIRKGRLGVKVEPVWDQYAVRVTGFEDNSAARSSGIEVDDIITKMDGHEFATIEELKYYLSKYKPGDTVNLTISHDGEIKSVKVVLGEEIISIDKFKHKEKKKPV